MSKKPNLKILSTKATAEQIAQSVNQIIRYLFQIGNYALGEKDIPSVNNLTVTGVFKLKNGRLVFDAPETVKQLQSETTINNYNYALNSYYIKTFTGAQLDSNNDIVVEHNLGRRYLNYKVYGANDVPIDGPTFTPDPDTILGKIKGTLNMTGAGLSASDTCHAVFSLIVATLFSLFVGAGDANAAGYTVSIPASTASIHGVPYGTVAQMNALTGMEPAWRYDVIDSSDGTCSSGGASTWVPCCYNGSAWTECADSGGVGGLTWIDKSAAYTAAAGEGVHANTSGGSFILSLPASPASGDEVGIVDARGTFNTNNLSINVNGSKFRNQSLGFKADIKNSQFILHYVDATEGWVIRGFTNEAAAY